MGVVMGVVIGVACPGFLFPEVGNYVGDTMQSFAIWHNNDIIIPCSYHGKNILHKLSTFSNTVTYLTASNFICDSLLLVSVLAELLLSL